MNKGEIYFVDLMDKIGSEQGGKRPVMILFNGTNNIAITAALTTKKKRDLPVHIELLPEETGLNQTSYILLEQINLIPKEDLQNKMGYLQSTRKWDAIRQGFRISLGI